MKKQNKIRNVAQWFEHLHKNPPAPFNPDYDPTCDKWWSKYCSLRRDALIAKYKELYPEGEVDGEHFGKVRHDILTAYVDPLREQHKAQAKNIHGMIGERYEAYFFIYSITI